MGEAEAIIQELAHLGVVLPSMLQGVCNVLLIALSYPEWERPNGMQKAHLKGETPDRVEKAEELV